MINFFAYGAGLAVTEAQRLRDKQKDAADRFYEQFEFSLDEANADELRRFESELAAAINARGADL